MLRITHRPNGSTTRLVLEGRLTGESVDELRRVASEVAGQGRRIALDLAGLLYADAAGVRMLRDLSDESAELQRASAFVSGLLGEPAP